MLNSSEQTFISLLGERLKNYLESNLDFLRDQKKKGSNIDIAIGSLHGYMEIIGMLQQQAEADGLTLKEIGLNDFDPEQYITKRIQEITGG